jgi:hypothetical protein
MSSQARQWCVNHGISPYDRERVLIATSPAALYGLSLDDFGQVVQLGGNSKTYAAMVRQLEALNAQRQESAP